MSGQLEEKLQEVAEARDANAAMAERVISERNAAEGKLKELRGDLRKALDALEVAALGAYEEALMPEDTLADPYEARKLVAVTQDYSGEYSCHWTPEGITFIRETIEETRAALLDQPPQEECR